MLSELIKTDRLILRVFSLVDVEDVLLYASDPEWARFLPVPQPYTRADAEKFVAGQVLQDRKTHACPGRLNTLVLLLVGLILDLILIIALAKWAIALPDAFGEKD